MNTGTEQGILLGGPAGPITWESLSDTGTPSFISLSSYTFSIPSLQAILQVPVTS